jgi:hypothetical protein
MPSSTQEQILQAVRAWLVRCTGLSASQIILWGDKGPRPALPYLTVRVILSGAQVGTGEAVYSETTTTLPAGWAPVTYYLTGAYVRPTSGTTPVLIYRATTTGWSGALTPTWPTVEGGTVVDGTVTWIAERRVRQWATAKGHFRATVQIDAWGHGAGDYLAAACLGLNWLPSREAAEAYGVAISRTLSAPQDLTGLRDTAYEVHVSQDFEVTYSATLVPATAGRAPAATSIDWDVTLDRTPNPPADLHSTGTEGV